MFRGVRRHPGQLGVAKPTADTYRVRTPSSADFGTANATIACIARIDAWSVSRTTFFSSFEALVGGFALRHNDLSTRLELLYTSGAANTTVTHTYSASLGDWHLWYGAIDAAGNYIVGTEAGETSGTSAILPSGGTPTVEAVLLGRDGGLAAHEGLATVAGMWHWSRALTRAELLALWRSWGATVDRSGLITEMRCHDGIPGDDSAVIVPTDTGGLPRAWTVAGAGDAYTWGVGPHPRRAVHQGVWR